MGDVRHAFNLHMIEPFSTLLLHSHYHGVHHAHPDVPWYKLRERFRAENLAYDGTFVRHFVAQLRGPIFSDTVTVREGRRSSAAPRTAHKDLAA